VVTPVSRGTQTLAVLVHDPALRAQRPLIDAVVAAARLALDNARLQARQQAQLADLRESRARIVLAGDIERRRIQRDLHDGIQHNLLATAMLIAQLRGDLAGAAGVPTRLAMASTQLSDAISELRALSEGIHPPALAELGLAGALESVAERAPLPVVVDAVPRRWPEHIERAAYFVITEALANVYKHASANRARVDVDGDDNHLAVTVTDDGTGGADPSRGSGLCGLYDRISALGGRLTVDSPPGRGTRVTAELPCAS
jgi:signal transduction histidine kinase